MQWKKAIIIPIPKKSSKRMSNFNGIHLMSIAARVFSRVILNTIYDKISPIQAEFRRGKKFNPSGKHNIRRTFLQSVNRETMWKILRNYGVPEKIVNFIKYLYMMAVVQRFA